MTDSSEKTVPSLSLASTEASTEASPAASERDGVLIGSENTSNSQGPDYPGGFTLAIVLIADLLAVFLVAATQSAYLPWLDTDGHHKGCSRHDDCHDSNSEDHR